MMRLIAAAAIAAAVSTTAPRAQDGPPMDEQLSMLELSAKRELTAIGLGDVDPMSLSLNQLGRIHSIMGSGSGSENDKAQQIRQVVEGG